MRRLELISVGKETEILTQNEQDQSKDHTGTTHYIHTLSNSPTHVHGGISVHNFGPLLHKALEVQYVNVHQGHDMFQISKEVTRIYYILCGTGYFTIDKAKYHVRENMLVEVPPKVEYSYSGNMKLIILSTPRWSRGNDRSTRWNPDVGNRHLSEALPCSRWKLIAESSVQALLRLKRRFWKMLPLA
jgi:mannose-6-phosphate isomerase-like protein (cupin superfamily)